MHHPTDRITYHGLCYTSCGALAGTRNSSMGPPHEGSIRRPITPWANTLTTELHLAPKERKFMMITPWAEREREMFYLTMHSTHFIYGYMVSDIWLRTILIVRKETRCRHIGYSYLLTARVILYAPSHRQDNTYHSLCYTSRGALAGTKIAQWVHPIKDRSDDPSYHKWTLYHWATSLSPWAEMLPFLPPWFQIL